MLKRQTQQAIEPLPNDMIKLKIYGQFFRISGHDFCFKARFVRRSWNLQDPHSA